MASSAAANLWVLLGLGIAGVLLVVRRLRRPVRPDNGAFVARLDLLPPPQPPPPQARHPLTGLCFAIADAHEFKDRHMEWINSVKPDVDAFIIGNLSDDGELSINSSQDARKEVRVALNALRKDDGILVIPTVLGCPPKLNARELSSSNYNVQTSCLTSLSSMSGCCQVALPLGTHDKCPISVSFIARHGGDQFLLDTIQTMYATIQEQVEMLANSNVSSKHVMSEEAAEAAKEKGNIAFKEKQCKRQ